MTKFTTNIPHKQLQSSSSAHMRNRRGPRTTLREVRRRTHAPSQRAKSLPEAAAANSWNATQSAAILSTTRNTCHNTIGHTPSRTPTSQVSKPDVHNSNDEAPNNTAATPAIKTMKPPLPQEENETPRAEITKYLYKITILPQHQHSSKATKGAATRANLLIETAHHAVYTVVLQVVCEVCVLTRMMMSFAKAKTLGEREKALVRAFKFAPGILLQIPKHCLCDIQPQHNSPRLKKRYESGRWLKAHAEELWENTRARGHARSKREQVETQT